MLPIQIGAKDVAFPRLNLFSWYIYVLGGILVIISLFGAIPANNMPVGWGACH